MTYSPHTEHQIHGGGESEAVTGIVSSLIDQPLVPHSKSRSPGKQASQRITLSRHESHSNPLANTSAHVLAHMQVTLGPQEAENGSPVLECFCPFAEGSFLTQAVLKPPLAASNAFLHVAPQPPTAELMKLGHC